MRSSWTALYTIILIAALSLWGAHFNLRRIHLNNSLNSWNFTIDRPAESPFVETTLETQNGQDCAITISSWRNFGIVQILSDSAQKYNPALTCFIWFVADDPYQQSEKVNEIRNTLAATQRISIVTLDRLSQNIGNDLDFFHVQVFRNEVSEKEATDLLLPFTFQYMAKLHNSHNENVTYLDTLMWSSQDASRNNSTRARLFEARVSQDLQQNHELYREELMGKYRAAYFEDISHGFHHFSDGTEIERWMRTLYTEMTTPVHLEGKFIVATVSTFSILHFQERVYKDPFQASLLKSGSFSDQITYMDWLLSGPRSKAIDMEGLFYFSNVEEHIWTDHRVHQVTDEPTGKNFLAFKDWFNLTARQDGLVSEPWFEKVKSKYLFSKANHWHFHKNSSTHLDVGVNLIGWHTALFSYGNVARNVFQAMLSVGVSASAIQINIYPGDTGIYMHPRDLGYPLTRSCPEPVNLVMINWDITNHGKSFIPSIIWKSKYNIGYWLWELEVFPRSGMDYLVDYDEIWVASTFVSDCIKNSPGYDGTPVKVLHIPLVLIKNNTERSSQNMWTQGRLKDLHDKLDGRFVFLLTCDFMSVGERKNPQGPMRAFLDAFPLETDLNQTYHLVAKTTHGSQIDLDNLSDIAGGDPRIHFVSELLTDAEVKALQKRVDCYVSLHRSEGYGMNILEAMGHGIPVIATNYSGNVDFSPFVEKYLGECYFPVPFKLTKLESNIWAYEAGNHWAEPDHDFAVNAMRRVVQNKCKEVHGSDMANDILVQFGLKAIGNKVKELLKESLPLIQRKEASSNNTF